MNEIYLHITTDYYCNPGRIFSWMHIRSRCIFILDAYSIQLPPSPSNQTIFKNKDQKLRVLPKGNRYCIPNFMVHRL